MMPMVYAIIGGIVTAIAIHYLDKWEKQSKLKVNQELVDVLSDSPVTSEWLSLEAAASELGCDPVSLVELRARGKIFGYRQGATWKFKRDEVDRVKKELGAWLDVPFQ